MLFVSVQHENVGSYKSSWGINIQMRKHLEVLFVLFYFREFIASRVIIKMSR